MLNSLQITVSFDETTTLKDVDKPFKAFALSKPVSVLYLYHKVDIFNLL